MSDLRFAARMLAKSPGFTLVAVSLIAVGIGANALIFSALDAVLLRPLPVRHPEQLVRMVQTSKMGTLSLFHTPLYEALRDHSTTLSAVFGEAELHVAMTEPGPAEQVIVRLPTPEFFDELGAQALYGRTLTADDARENPGMPPAVLSYGFWQRRFDGHRDALGKAIVLHGHKFVIVGVMPREFNGISTDTAPDVRVPLRMFPVILNSDPQFRFEYIALDLGGRLRLGVTRQQAQAECRTVWHVTEADLARKGMDTQIKYELRQDLDLDPLEHGVSILRNRFGTSLKLSAVSVALLLLMVCANVAGLLLARNASRREEIAVRLAMGATRFRLIRQMLVEGLLLTAPGAAGGLLIAFALTGPLTRSLPPLRDATTTRQTLSIAVGPDHRVLLFSLAISTITALLFGLAPAITASRTNIDAVLRRARTTGTWRGRAALLTFQITLCTLLLAGAGLLVRTFQHLKQTDPGFDQRHIMTFSAAPALTGYSEAQSNELLKALTGRVREMPGVRGVAFSSVGVLRGRASAMTVAPEGQQTTPADFLNTAIHNISDDYFGTMGMHILAGRDLSPTDDPVRKPAAVVINQTFARRFFPDGDPIGKRFGVNQLGGPVAPDYQIVGVVSDAKYRFVRDPMAPTFYAHLRDFGYFVLYVRVQGRPESFIEPVRKALAALDSSLPFTEIHTLSEEVDASIAGERLTALLASIFGSLAAFLTAVGIYGLLAYAVTQRRREIGIRMTLGASPGDIMEMIGRQTIVISSIGIALGLGAALVAAPAIRSLLYGVAPSDSESLGAAAVFVALVAGAATAIPAMRAARTEPAVALRQEN